MVTKRGSEIRSFGSILTAACFRLSKCRAVCTESSVSFIGRRGSFSAGDCRSYLRQFGCSDFSPPRADASDETVPTGKNDTRTLRIRRCDFAHAREFSWSEDFPKRNRLRQRHYHWRLRVVGDFSSTRTTGTSKLPTCFEAMLLKRNGWPSAKSDPSIRASMKRCSLFRGGTISRFRADQFANVNISTG